MNSEENKKIRREITYLSGLNHKNIVRYFQTWVERETDLNVIAEFEDEYYDEEESSEDSFVMNTVDSGHLNGRSNSMGRKAKVLPFQSSL